MNQIMLVDDDVSIIDGLQRRMKKHRKNWDVETYSDPLKALEAQKSKTYEVIISDFNMSPINGVVFLKESRVFQRDAIRIVLSGQAQMDAVIQAINEAEIYRYVEKPVDTTLLLSIVDQALHFRTVMVENEKLAGIVRRQKNELAKAKHYIDTYTNTHQDESFPRWENDEDSC